MKQFKNAGKTLLLLLLALTVAMSFPVSNACAATKKQKALNAYKKFLSKSTVYVLKKGQEYTEYSDTSYAHIYKGIKSSKVKFATAYIDNDNVPELIVMSGTENAPYYGVFTYKNGKMVRLYNTCWNGAYTGIDLLKGYYPKTGIFHFESWNEGVWHTLVYEQIKGTKANPRVEVSKDYRNKVGICWINENQKSEAACKKTLKSLTKSKKLVKFKFYKNTSANRKKRLK